MVTQRWRTITSENNNIIIEPLNKEKCQESCRQKAQPQNVDGHKVMGD